MKPTMTRGVNARRRFAAILASVLCLPRWAFGMGSAPKPPKPPLYIPFAVHRKGAVIDTEMRVVEDMTYRFGLEFRFKKNDEQDRRRVTDLLADHYTDAEGRHRMRHQVAVSLRIWEVDSSDDRLIFDQRLDEYQFGGGTGAGSTDRPMANFRLRPGLYRLRVESLKDIPALETVSTEFTVYWRGK